MTSNTKDYAAQHYQNNKELYKARARESKARMVMRNQSHVWGYLFIHPCVDCGEANPIVLDFDHLDAETKLLEISKLVSRGYSINAIDAEIAKCEVVCANCHRKRTARRGNHIRHRMFEEIIYL